MRTPESLFSSLAVIAVILITVGYFSASEPEDSQITSSDGVLTVTALTRQSQPIKLTSGTMMRAPLLEASYRLSPDEVTLDEPAVLAFRTSGVEQIGVETLAVYRFRADLGMWEEVSPVVAHSEEVIAIETAQLGEFAIGSVPVFEAPVFANIYDELRDMAPATAVGYETAVGFSGLEQETIRLLKDGEAGGCGGVIRVGDGEETSRLEREVTVPVGDSTQTFSFVFVTRWFTSSTGGCGDGEPLRPLAEYDILEKIQNP